MNLAILHYSCPPIVGGVEEIIRQQASLFYRYYHSVKIIAGQGAQYTDEYPIEIHPWFQSRHPEILTLQRDPEQYEEQIKNIADKIRAYLEESLNNIDILIAHNVLTMPYNLPLTLALHSLAHRGRIKVVSWNHDSPYFYQGYNPDYDSGAWRILKTYNPNIFYITISQSRAVEFQRLYNVDRRLTVIPNGIDPIRFFRLAPTTVRLIKEADLFNADLLIVQPSRLHPRKNIELSIQVLHALHRKNIQAKLLLTGAYDPHEPKTIDYYQDLKNLARTLEVQEEIIILANHEFKSGQKISSDRVIMRDIYHIADLLFLPSKSEGFGIPLLEAGMLKLPIVCSDIAPFRLIGNQDVCYFSLKDTPGQIAERILQFLHQLPPHAMFRNVIRNYVWDNIYQRWLIPFLERVLGQ